MNFKPYLCIKAVDELKQGFPIPAKGSAGAAAYDLRSRIGVILAPGQQRLIPTGYIWQIPEGWCGYIMPRSGHALKLQLDRRAGLIDSDYRGEVCALLRNESAEDIVLNEGDRVAQMVLVEHGDFDIKVTSHLDDTQRGDKGFGSSGVE